MSLGYILIDLDPFEADLAILRLLLPDDFDQIREEVQTITPADGVGYIRQLAQQLA